MRVVERLEVLGGVARRTELATTAADKRLITEMVAAGALRDLGAGWVAATVVPPSVVAARRFNATVTCVSAAELYELQQLTVPDRVHLAVPRARGARPDPLRRQITIHRESDWTRPASTGLPLAPIAEVLGRVLRCRPENEAVITVDSALNKGLVTVEEIDRTLRGPGSRGARAALDRCEPRSRSATETLARLALRTDGLEVAAGVVIGDVGEVDLVVEGRVVVECDGFSYHSGRREYREDRRRDRALVALGYLVLRFTWEDIMTAPETVVAAVRAALAR